MTRPAAGWFVLAGLALAAPACREPPRAPRHDAARDAAAAGADARSRAPSGPPARAFVIEDPADLLHGPYAVGRLGDVRLDNDRAAFVVRALGEPFGFARTGGNLVDAAALPPGRDELAQVVLQLGGEFPRQAVYRELGFVQGAPGEALVVARGVDARDPQLELETIYALAPGTAALRLTTILRYRGPRPPAGLEVGDAILWGGASAAAAALPPCPPAPALVPYLAAVGDSESYAYLGADPLGFRCGEATGRSWSVLASFDLPTWVEGDPGKTVVRWLAVGERSDTTSATAAARTARGDPLERIAIRTTDAAGEPVADAVVRLTRDRGAPPETLRTDAGGRGVALLPAGRWRATAEAPARTGAGLVSFEAPTVEPVELPLGPPGRLELDVQLAESDGAAPRRAPVRVVVHGVPPASDPSFGGPFSAGGAGPTFVAADGRSSRPLPPGTYEVLVTRGPEYELLEQTVDVPPDGVGRVHGTLVRRVETAGWLAADFHVHTSGSTDAGTTPRDRVLACAAEGIELLAATDHNETTDLTPHVEALGLADDLLAVVGTEVTTDGSRVPIGHLAVFPLALDPALPHVATPVPWLDLGYPELVAGARRIPGVLVQVNHPRSPRDGTFDLLGVGIDDATLPASWTMDFDLLEVADGRWFDRTPDAVADWARLVRCGRRVTPTGGSGAHALTDPPCGWPRTWVFAGRDAAGGYSPDALAAALRSGRVVVSTGPFVVLRVDDVPAGGTVVPKGRGALISVRVEAAPWIDVARVRVLVNGREALSLPPTARPPEAVRLETQAPLAVSGDAAVWAEVEGTSVLPVLEADSPIRPWALTGAVWIDANGDGKLEPGGAGCAP
ncbi:MAG: CehA/McbA family metallohydrolase [Deltaproteobacteria bacterium]|nr:CehA/McbA family metallohydrolase [Deltaproteobacteria bacterium]